MSEISKLDEKRVFYYFEQISNIPRATGNTLKITEYLCEFAKQFSYYCYSDTAGNVLIRKPAAIGYEDHEPVILQGHIDMVCEKNYEVAAKHDFSKDPLNLAVMDDYIFARGTSLGADDGIAVAYILAILEDPFFYAPEIEALFTVDEENGMQGALLFDKSKLKGRRLINIDHEVEGEILTCSAGGRRVCSTVRVRYTEKRGIKSVLTVCGLCGGHSGTEIDKQRANANLLMGRMLHWISKRLPFSVMYLNGGLVDTAIPREARAEIVVDEQNLSALEQAVYDFEAIIRREYEGIEDNCMIYSESMDSGLYKVLTDKTQERIIFLLNTVPDGIIKMNRESDRLVQTSLNNGIMRLTDDNFELYTNIRSLAASEKESISDKVQYLTETIGGEFSIETDYPAWEYKRDSDLRELAFDIYQQTFGRNPRLTGFHAGLECGIFYDAIPSMDIISFGPDISDIHTCKEKMSILSANRVFEYLCNILHNC